MIIKIMKFGTTLISRPKGKEAYLSLQQTLKDTNKQVRRQINPEKHR